jgi:two-component system sensor histidine kinase BaeS
VLENLLSNAITYSPDDCVIRVRLSHEHRSAKSWATLAVCDEGFGIPQEDLPHVFQRFYRAQNARGRMGTGLGLWGARQIVEQHGGTLTLTSTEGAGTEVTLRLPCQTKPG